MKEKWFKAKSYGWGWTPATWQGWSVILLFVIIVAFLFFSIDSNSHSASDTMINFIPNVVILSMVLIIICYLTGEKPSWNWGNKRKTRKR